MLSSAAGPHPGTLGVSDRDVLPSRLSRGLHGQAESGTTGRWTLGARSEPPSPPPACCSYGKLEPPTSSVMRSPQGPRHLTGLGPKPEHLSDSLWDFWESHLYGCLPDLSDKRASPPLSAAPGLLPLPVPLFSLLPPCFVFSFCLLSVSCH